MTLFLLYGLKVTLLLLLAGVFYRLVLERAPLGHFKRGYLLLALVFAHLVPLLPVRSIPAPAVPDTDDTVVYAMPVAAAEWAPVIESEVVDNGFDAGYLFILVYAAGFLFTGRRFLRSVRQMMHQARRGHRQRYGRAWLIELPGQVMPHSFGRWIFYGADNPPAPAILAHEYAHVIEGHTVDRLFIALLRTACWFNPLLYYYERAIIFNHEYLADRAVLRQGYPLRDYQYGLLAALSQQSASTRLASGANFHFTKKRLQMMLLPAVSPARTTVLWGLTLALGMTLLWSFGRTTVIPAEPAVAQAVTPPNNAPATARDTVPPPPPPAFSIQERQPRRPTADQLAVWLDADAYGVWIDGKRVDNAELERYDAADFSFYTISRLMRNARNYGLLDYEVNLMTNAVFQRNRFIPNWQSSSCRWEPAPAKEDC